MTPSSTPPNQESSERRPLTDPGITGVHYLLLIPTGILWYEGISPIYLWNYGRSGFGHAGGVCTNSSEGYCPTARNSRQVSRAGPPYHEKSRIGVESPWRPGWLCALKEALRSLGRRDP